MGGRIAVESDAGSGSTFTFTARFGVADSAGQHTPYKVRSAFEGLPVLVVSSTAVGREVGSTAVAELGTRPTAVDGPVEAMVAVDAAHAEDRPFALIVVDLGAASLSFGEELRSRPELSDVHIIIVTSTGQRGDAARCRELNIAGYLTRPNPPEDLVEAAKAVLSGPAPLDLSLLVTRHWLRERRRRLSVLVVDDSPTNRMVVTRMLEQRGHTVTAAVSGMDAVALTSAHRFDVVIMDVWMPEVDGLEASGKIRRMETMDSGHVPIVAVTSRQVDGLDEACREAGIDVLLTKPFEFHALVTVIEELVAA
jgi:CheY-like chemotaxis protein